LTKDFGIIDEYKQFITRVKNKEIKTTVYVLPYMDSNNDLLRQAILEHKSMDLDVSIDDSGNPYLGHSKEFHEKSGEPFYKTMPLWDAVEMIAESDIVAMVDVKHYDSWQVVEEVVRRVGPSRCLVCSYVDEFKFNFSRGENEPDFLTEWSPLDRLVELKCKHPSVTITPCAKWLPDDLLLSEEHHNLREGIRRILRDCNADTVCLGVPDNTISDRWLRLFLEDGIIPHIMIDHADISNLTELYIGETDFLKRTSDSRLLNG
jgi:hypothetical protein